ncbi:Hypothetical predicted protein [Paramuricea clavata]|uniref:Uncharacterized protein n=1 Tax=Paramuricea clavata TaxID=317549 RepID=A0A6S7FFD3_PARCT|nr:Hypothetical predicted protein [Paramuricea clavata]
MAAVLVAVKDLTWLTYDGLIKAVEELNIILDDLTKSEGNNFQLLFAVSSTDDSYLWKAFVRVTCCKNLPHFSYLLKFS